MPTTIKLRRGTAAQWTTANPVLAAGEPGHETDTGKHKIGDGSKTWSQLEYFLPESALTATIAAEVAPLQTELDGVPAAIAAAVASLKYRTDPGGETIMSRLDTGAGNVNLTVLGDSTGNDTNEWVRLATNELAAAHPALHVEDTIWNGGTLSYPALTVRQAGTGYTPAGPQTVLDDTFTRTDSNLIGDAPDVGPAWSGTSGANNAWRTDGSKMVRDGAVASSAGVASQLGEYGDMTITLDNVTLSTLGDTVNREFNVYFRASNNGADGIRLRVQIAATTGNVSWHLFKLVASASTTLATGGANPIPAATASNTFDLTIDTSGRDITVTLNGATLNHTLSEADHGAITGTDFIINSSAGTLVGMSIERVTVAIDRAASGQALIVHNGSQPGATLAYQTTNLAAMLPTDTDVVVISSSHNYGDDDAASYLTALDTFVGAVQAQAPAAKVIVSSQNPEFVGTFGQAEVDAHLARLAALRVKAVEEGWGYVPVLEAFLSQPDRGESLVKADGIHPTTATDNPTVNGEFLWRDTFLAYLDAHSLVG